VCALTRISYSYTNTILCSPEHKVLRVSICDSPLSVVRQCVSACVNFFIHTTSSLKPLTGFWPNITGMIHRCSSTKVVHAVRDGCISWSRNQIIGLQNAIFKNLLVWSLNDQSFQNWYITSFRGHLPKLFKLCPLGQNWPRPNCHNFTLNFIRKTSNDFFSWTANGKLIKLNRNGPWVVPYQNCWNGCDLFLERMFKLCP